MRKHIQLAGLGGIGILLSLICYVLHTTTPFIQIIKYISMAYGVAFLTYSLLFLHKKKHTFSILFYMAIAILCVFTILTIDTYWLHALSWFPGIIRYPIFSTYGWIHVIFFMLIGLCLYYGKIICD